MAGEEEIDFVSEEPVGIPTEDEIPEYTADGVVPSKMDWLYGVDVSALPTEYRSNSLKEQLCLEYAEDFRRQFVELFPDRRPLFLSARSEGGCAKLVCTTVRPTLAPIRELYDLEASARFVSRYCRYEPLSDARNAPEYLPSPGAVLQRRAGDSFDLSVLLTSLLVGAGYRAYVAVGTAPAWVTLRDRSEEPLSFSPPSLPEEAPGYQRDVGSALYGLERRPPSPIPDRYARPESPVTDSKYDAMMAARKAEEEAAREAADEYESEEDVDTRDDWIAGGRYEGTTKVVPGAAKSGKGSKGEEEEVVVEDDSWMDESIRKPHYVNERIEDDLEGERLHAWVVVLPGARGVEEVKFVETSVGRIFSASDAPYYAIETLFNHLNIWVNMQTQMLVPALQQWAVRGDEKDGEEKEAEMKSDGDGKGDDGKEDGGDGEEMDPIEALKKQALEALRNPPTKEAAIAAVAEFLKETEGKEEEEGGDGGGKEDGKGDDGEGEMDGGGEGESGDEVGGEEESGKIEDGGAMSFLRFDLEKTEDWENVFIPAVIADLSEEADGSGSAEDGGEEGGEEDGTGEREGGEDGTGVEDGGEDEAGEGEDGGESKEDGGKGDGEEDVDFEPDGEHILDLAPSWPELIRVPREAVRRGLGLGEGGRNLDLYHRATLEEFAPYAHGRGLVLRVTEYADDARLLTNKVTEVFEHRSDKLVMRVTQPLEWQIVEHFAPGRERGDGLRRITERVGHSREAMYWTAARVDGLKRRLEIFGHKIIEEFDPGAADNRLVYRSITFVGPSSSSTSPTSSSSSSSSHGVEEEDDGSGGLTSQVRVMEASGGMYRVSKMSLQFARNPEKSAHQDIAKIKFLLSDGEIHVKYHTDEGRVVSTIRAYTVSEGSASLRFLAADPFAPLPSPFERETDFRHVLALQRVCFDEIRAGHRRNGAKLLEDRVADEEELILERDVFEIAHQRVRERVPIGEEGEEEQVEDTSEPDPLAPFLLGVRDPEHMSYEEAKDVRQQCEEALKRRHLDRMMIIQRRLDAEEEALQRKQREFGRARGDDPAATEAFERQCAEHIFRIGILQQRLKRQDKQFRDRILEMAAIFRADRRLAKLYAHEGAPTE